MNDVLVEALEDAIRNLHGCESRYVESVPVTETFDGKVVWTGEVQVFDLIDHPAAERCYAWSHAMGDSERRRFVAVLHNPPVDSPEAAVRVAIVAEHRD